MALPIVELIALDLAAALAAIPGVTFRRGPENDFDEEELPALGLRTGDDRTETGETIDISIEHTEFLISGHVVAETGAAVETAANDLYGQALAAVMLDYTRGGLATNTVKIGRMMLHNESDEGNKPLAGFQLIIRVEYRVSASDPTVLSP